MAQQSKKKPRPTIREAEYYRSNCVAFNLRRATRIITRRYEDALRPIGMKAFQFTALAALSQHHTMPQLVLADFFGMDVSTLNRNIRAMERKGWITYTDDPADGRKKHVKITRSGRNAFASAAPLWEQAQADTKAMMSDFEWNHERAWLDAVSGETGGPLLKSD